MREEIYKKKFIYSTKKITLYSLKIIMNEIIRNLTIENLLNVKSSFDHSKKIFWDEQKNKLVHPGEYGTYRERLIKNWLRIYIPKKFEIASGFLINSDNKISKQCDIIIYDRDNTPQIQNMNEQLFFPIETVAVVGEVKSDINGVAKLNTHLEKLSEVKKLREGVKFPKPYFRIFQEKYNPALNPFDNVFTFIICNKLNMNLTQNPINYECELRHKHNLVLSLQDGLLTYGPKNEPSNVPFPFGRDEIYYERFIKDDGEELPAHIGIFLSSLHTALISITLLEIDMALYLSDNIFDQSSYENQNI